MEDVRANDLIKLAAREAAALAAFPDFGRPPKRKKTSTLEDAFWARTRAEGDHRLWTGSRTNQGYGQVKRNGTTVLAHRQAWEYRHGPIPAGLYVVHTCPFRACLAHLKLDIAKHRGPRRAYPRKRKAHCVRGHPLDGAYVDPQGFRHCHACHAEANVRYRERQKERDMWKTDTEGQVLCGDCNRGLDDTRPVLVLGDDGMVPICGRCSRNRRLRMAAADAVEATVLGGTSEGGWN